MTTEAVTLQERVATLEEQQNHLATKEDVERLRAEMERTRGDMQASMERLRGDMQAEMERLRGDMQASMEKLRGDMQADMERLRAEMLVTVERAQTNATRWMVGAMIGTAGLAVSITIAVNRLL